MKSKFFSMLAIAAIFSIASCHDDDKHVSVRNFKSTHCKSVSNVLTMSFGEMQNELAEKVIYTAQGSYLHILHENALHNCYEENTVDVSVKVEGDSIFIKTVDTQPLANCVCEYDLEYEVGPLSYGNYVISIDNDLEFPITFSASTNGVYPE